MAITSIKTGSSFTNLQKYNDFLGPNAAFDPNAFVPIATATGTGSSGTITFSSIPATYQHLQLRFMVKTTETTSIFRDYRLRFNGDTGSNYARHTLTGDGATASAAGAASVTEITAINTVIPTSNAAFANMMGVGIVDLHDYTSTTKNKTVRIFTGADVNRSTAPVGRVTLNSGLYFATPAAITSITFVLTSGSLTTSSVLSLYGIKGA
jgi:hypothetical protein